MTKTISHIILREYVKFEGEDFKYLSQDQAGITITREPGELVFTKGDVAVGIPEALVERIFYKLIQPKIEPAGPVDVPPAKSKPRRT
jgi:hypothetical protein